MNGSNKDFENNDRKNEERFEKTNIDVHDIMKILPYVSKLPNFGSDIANYAIAAYPNVINMIIKVNKEGDGVKIRVICNLPNKIPNVNVLEWTSGINIEGTNFKEDIKSLTGMLETLAFDTEVKREEMANVKMRLYNLYTSLIGGDIREFVKNNYNEIETIWIDCDIEEINPFWELLYVKLESNDSFFWGDQFAIARVPSSYNNEKIAGTESAGTFFSNAPENLPLFKSLLDVKVNGRVKIGLIRKDKSLWADKEEEYFNGNKDCEVIETIKEVNEFPKLDGKSFDIVHLVTHHEGNILSLSDADVTFAEIHMRNPNCTNIVFFNVCKSEVICPTMFGMRKKLADQDCFETKKAWIGTYLSVGEEPAYDFVETFYNKLLEGNPIANSAKEARNGNKNKNKNIMRLFYTVHGPPFTKLVRV
jgi:hypothetical protein